MAIEIRMPQISMTMLDGTIVKWLKKEGDPVAEGEDLVEIQTDKVVETLSASATGVVQAIVAKEDETVPVGELLCRIAAEGEAVPSKKETPAPVSPAAPRGDAPGAANAIRMPQISMTMLDGTIVKWLKKEGDFVKEGEDLVEIQTDKVVETLSSSATGVLRAIVAKEDATVPVGEVICIVGEEGAVAPAPAGGPVSAAASLPQPAVASPAQTGGKGSRRASPLAKKIAVQESIDLSLLTGTGPGGMIVKADVLEFAASAQNKPAAHPQKAALPPLAAAGEDTVVPFAGIRKTIADNLMMSKRSAADVTTVADVDMGKIKKMRQVLPISYTAFCLKAAAKALEEYPVMNALVEEERIIMKKRINLSVAVATNMGLLTPVIQDAGNKNLMTVSDDLLDLSERGRTGNLTARDFEGGTFTVTNSGVFGSILFTPIINHPQSAVLGLGRIAKVPVVKEDDTIVPALMMYMSLTYNHRAIDGETAVKFLQRVRYYLENPAEMMGFKKPVQKP